MRIAAIVSLTILALLAASGTQATPTGPQLVVAAPDNLSAG